MTFCLAIKVSEGLVGIADTRVISGNENITARKYSVYEQSDGRFFLMASGLRSAWDKALTYFEEVMETHEEPHNKLFKIVNVFADQVRRVASEDKAALEASGLPFNIRCMIGGQMSEDAEHKLYLVYPEGNWVEIGQGTPYQIIGAAGYGKPVLDRTLQYHDSMRFALKVGSLAFDSTRISAADVDFPIDVILYFAETKELVTHRFEHEDMLEITDGWQERLRNSVTNLPSEWLERFFATLHPFEPDIPKAFRGSLRP